MTDKLNFSKTITNSMKKTINNKMYEALTRKNKSISKRIQVSNKIKFNES